MIQNAMCHAISASAKTEFQPNQIGSKHCYTMNKGKMVIRTKNIANFPAVWTRRNDVEDAYLIYRYTLESVHARTHVASLIKQNKTQKQTTKNKKSTLTNELKT